jgi:glutathionyl-hydroquinone reductase
MRSDEDRRDRDLLVEIHTMTKSLNENFDEHLKQDREDFKSVNTKINEEAEKIHKRINKINWYLAGVMGGLVVLEFILNFSRK